MAIPTALRYQDITDRHRLKEPELMALADAAGFSIRLYRHIASTKSVFMTDGEGKLSVNWQAILHDSADMTPVERLVSAYIDNGKMQFPAGVAEPFTLAAQTSNDPLPSRPYSDMTLGEGIYPPVGQSLQAQRSIPKIALELRYHGGGALRTWTQHFVSFNTWEARQGLWWYLHPERNQWEPLDLSIEPVRQDTLEDMFGSLVEDLPFGGF
ncbi:hypothetical protein BDZ89DRAFT_1108862 [Hymenopellis radicata]|nr:hypothetical protein BDZ89DRAFT_1108862 [Hymenopellis radicata]